MNVLTYAKITALAAVTFLCITLGLAGLQLRKAAIGLEQTEQTINTLVGHADTQVQAVGSETHRVLLEAGLTAREARLASTTQRKFWDNEVPVLAAKSELTIDRTNTLLSSLQKTSDGLNKNTGLRTWSLRLAGLKTPSRGRARSSCRESNNQIIKTICLTVLMSGSRHFATHEPSLSPPGSLHHRIQ